MSLNIDPSTTTILLIDDNDKDRTYYAERIRIGVPDCHVYEARDGKSGLELYKSHRIDCIVTELYLPDMSGFELLVEVVPHARKPTMAVVMLTRAVWKPLHDLAREHGVQACLVKRFTTGDELGPIIQKAIATVGSNRKDRWMHIRDREPEQWDGFTRQCLALLATANGVDGTCKGNLQLYNPLHNGLQIIVQRGFDVPFLTFFDFVHADSFSACARAFRDGQRILIPDIDDDLSFRPYVSIAKVSGFHAVQSTPITGVNGAIVGVFSTHAAERHKWGSRALEGLDMCAAEIRRLVLRMVENS